MFYTAEGDQHAVLWTPISLPFSQLIGDVTGLGPAKSLERCIASTNAYDKANTLQATCAALGSFIGQVTNHANMKHPKISAAEFEALTEDAQAIIDEVGFD